MVKLIGNKAMNTVVSRLGEVNDAVQGKAKDCGDLAKANLAEARASTRWSKISGPDHLTKVDVTHGEVDSFVNLEAPNAMAIEFGHQPSGFFEGTDTKSPDGLYILTRAAGVV